MGTPSLADHTSATSTTAGTEQSKMQVTINRADIVSAAAWAVRYIPARPAHPVLAGLLIEIDGTEPGRREVRFTGRDWDTAASATVTAEVEVPGRILVSGALLAAICKHLTGDTVHLVADDSYATVTSGAAEFRMPLLPLDEVPATPAPVDLVGEVNSKALAAAIGHVGKAASRDDAVPMVTGICIGLTEDGCLQLAATDRYRAATRDLSWQPPVSGGDTVFEPLLVPAQVLLGLAAGMTGDEDTVRITTTTDRGVVRFSNGSCWVTTRLLDVKFPPLARVIPTKDTTTSMVAREDLAGCVRRMGTVAGSADQLVLTFGDAGITVTATDESYNSATEHITTAVEGPAITLAARSTYLLAALAGITTDQVHIGLTEAVGKPILLRPVGVDGEPRGDALDVVMTLRLPGGDTDKASVTGEVAA
ncbi:DNA polymerase III subunit beta [Pseudonocardiaceae bacterium YIM PH 21723]|nr:DNA polymerase III subunit beta [Pseudonocardiaceae bacterium YIM PH 21723]